ncbi:MAG: flagellar protein FlgN [Candidatus Tectomicrobia bacterium]|nr:flagellar protein FlgN [Candidatus Tectomicrobia bacterium]
MHSTDHEQTLEVRCLDLVALLREEEEELRELVGLLQEEKRVYLSFALEALQACNKRKETVALRLRMLEETRGVLVEQVAAAVGCEAHGVTLRDLCGWVPDACRAALEERASVLRALSGGIRELIAENRAYIDYSLRSIKDSLQLLTQASAPGATYGPSGALGGAERSGVFIRSRM